MLQLKYDVYQIKMDRHLDEFIDTSQFKPHSRNETEGPCPICGGEKRFHIILGSVHGDQWFCRHCTGERYRGDIFNFLEKMWNLSFPEVCERLSGGTPLITPNEAILKRLDALEKSNAEQGKKLAEIERKFEELREKEPWKAYHEQINETANRALWWARGVPDGYVYHWRLGYSPDFTFKSGDEWQHSPTLTFPIFGLEWQLMGIRHRILHPPTPNDRYRPEPAGLPVSPFLSDPDGTLSGKTLVVEGEIKAMVTYARLEDSSLQVMGLPGKGNIGEATQKLLIDAEPVYICFDPDAQADAEKLARDLGRNRCRIIRLPDKIDDLILRHGLGRSWMNDMMRTAIRVD